MQLVARASASSARSGAFVLGPFVVETIYDAELSGRTLAMLALGSAFYMVGLATRAGRDRPARATRSSRSAGASAWSSFVLGTWLSSDELFRRVEIGLVLVEHRRARVLRARRCATSCARGVEPTPASVMDAITDMPLES